MTHAFHAVAADRNLGRRQLLSRCFAVGCRLCVWFTLFILMVLLGSIGWSAWGWLDWQFLTSYHSTIPEEAGLFAGIWGSFWMVILMVAFSVPLGVGTAIYLEEYATDNWFTRVIKTNLANLAGVPSIVYGMLGLAAFARIFGLFTKAGGKPTVFSLLGLVEFELPFGRSVISGSLTMTLLILPVVVIAAQEALRAVPSSIRSASLALGASRWQTIRYQVLPAAVPGIVTGIILSVSRAIGETAPLLMIGSLTTIFYTPGGIESPLQVVTRPGKLVEVPFSKFTAMPIQIYNWVGQAKAEFYHVAAAGIVTLLAVLLLFNALAVWIRYRASKKVQW